jgi:hypothetical protein
LGPTLLFKSVLSVLFLFIGITISLSQSVVKDFQFYTYGSKNLTSYHRNVFGIFQISSDLEKKKDNTYRFQIDFRDKNHDVIYQLKNNKEINVSESKKEFSIGRNSIHLHTNLETWSSLHPKLYELQIRVADNNTILDTAFTDIVGIRDIYWQNDELIVNQEDSILRAFQLKDQIQDIKIPHKAKSLFANTLIFNHLPSKQMISKCDSLGIYILINVKNLSSRDSLNNFLDINKNSPSIIAFLKKEEGIYPEFIIDKLKLYRNTLLLDKMPENIQLAPYDILNLNERRDRIIKEKFNPFKVDSVHISESKISVKINAKDFGSILKDFNVIVNFYDLENLYVKSNNIEGINLLNNRLEIDLPNYLSTSDMSKVELVIYPASINYWYNINRPLIHLKIY